MVIITLPDGTKKSFDTSQTENVSEGLEIISKKNSLNKVSTFDVANSISAGLARQSIAGKINGNLVDLNEQILEDSNIEIITSKSEESLEILRHTTAHIFAQALLRLFPKAKITIGPAVDNGFYYDVDCDELVDSDLIKIEVEMKKIIKENLEISYNYKSKEEALDFFSDNIYKTQIIKAIIDGNLNSDEEGEGNLEKEGFKFYKQGEFSDICRGPHLPRTGLIKAFKLERITKAYWRGDSNNKQLNRIYGTAFWKKSQMDDYFKMLEEAKKRDHRILGKQMKLFTISELIGSGLPLFQPRGMVIRKEIEDYLWDLHKFEGYDRVWTPHIAKLSLYETSGHAAKFGDELFKVKGKVDEFIMKPMNCPHHMQIFADNYFTYKDMPIRYFEPATIYRDELSGALSGLARVRAITQDDGHLFCRVDQIEDEVSVITKIIKKFYETFNMTEDYWVSLSVRDLKTPQKYLGTDDVWEKAESALENAAKLNELPYKKVEGEAAFYGPKLDFMFKDCIGREWQLATIQCDFNLPQRFDLSYVDEQSNKVRPVVIHRAISGSLERGMALLIEHFAGKFPLWLSPVQIKIINVADRHKDYCKEIKSKLTKEGFRVETNFDNDGVGKKIAMARNNDKPNYMLILGDKDIENKTISIRTRKFVNGKNEEFTSTLDEFIKNLKEERDTKEIKN